MARDPSKLLEEAGAAFSAGNFQKAYDIWTSVLDDVDNEHHFALHTNRGAALERLGRVDDAIAAYDCALTAKPDHTEAWHNRGVALKAQKRFEEALESFETALTHTPSFYPSLRGRTDVLTVLERFDEAIAAADAAIASDSTQTGPHADKAFALLKSKRVAEAVDEYEVARAMGDDSAETTHLYATALSQRAVELDKSGDLSAAEDMYTRAIALEPTESRLFNRAFLYMRTGRNEQAVAGYKQVMQVAPSNFQARAALGTLLLQADSFEEAAAVLKEAQDLKPEAADVVFNLGFAYLKQDALDDAEKQFNRALELEAGMEQAKNGLAVVEQARKTGSVSKPPKYRLNLGPPVMVPAEAPKGRPAAPPAPPAPGARAGVPATSNVKLSLGRRPSGSAPVPAASAAPSKAAGSTPGTSSSPTAVQVRSPGVKPVVAKGDGGSSPASASTGALGGGSSLLARAQASGRAGRQSTVFASGVPVLADTAAGLSLDEPSKPAPRVSPVSALSQDIDGYQGIVHTYAELKAPGPYPDGIDLAHREAYLTMAEFVKVFGVPKSEFYKQPKWKRSDSRKKVGLF